jgi:hypothetical protein
MHEGGRIASILPPSFVLEIQPKANGRKIGTAWVWACPSAALRAGLRAR